MVPPFPRAIRVLHVTGQHIRNCLDAAMRVPGKALEILLRSVGPEIVEEQERIVKLWIAKTDRSMQMTPAPSIVGRLLMTSRMLCSRSLGVPPVTSLMIEPVDLLGLGLTNALYTIFTDQVGSLPIHPGTAHGCSR